MLHIIWSIIVGFIIGWLAQALYPGAQHLGFWKAALIGIGGSILGGLISRLSPGRSRARRFIQPVSSCRSSAL